MTDINSTTTTKNNKQISHKDRNEKKYSISDHFEKVYTIPFSLALTKDRSTVN